MPLAAQSVVQTLDQAIFTLPLGQGVACSNRVGNLLGKRAVRQARRTTYIAITLGFVVSIAIMVTLLGARWQIGQAFTDDRDVLKAVAAVLLRALCCVAS